MDSRLAHIHAALGRRRNTLDRDRTRPRRSKSPSEFPHAEADTVTRKVVYTTRIYGPLPDTLAAAPVRTLPHVTDRSWP
jgi:hypothetical protein